jgi:hypothetical protein
VNPEATTQQLVTSPAAMEGGDLQCSQHRGKYNQTAARDLQS